MEETIKKKPAPTLSAMSIGLLSLVGQAGIETGGGVPSSHEVRVALPDETNRATGTNEVMESLTILTEMSRLSEKFVRNSTRLDVASAQVFDDQFERLLI